jgi:hypothetical protein
MMLLNRAPNKKPESAPGGFGFLAAHPDECAGHEDVCLFGSDGRGFLDFLGVLSFLGMLCFFRFLGDRSCRLRCCCRSCGSGRSCRCLCEGSTSCESGCDEGGDQFFHNAILLELLCRQTLHHQ